LQSQRDQVATHHSAQQTLRAEGEVALQKSDFEIVQAEKAMKDAIQASKVTIEPIRATCSGRIVTRLDIDTDAQQAGVADKVAQVKFAIEQLMPPKLTGFSDSAPSYTVGKAITPNQPFLELLVTGCNQDGLVFTEQGLPPGLSISARDGTISGTPIELTAQGASPVSVTATNAAGASTLSLGISVVEPVLGNCRWCKQPMPANGNRRVCALPPFTLYFSVHTRLRFAAGGLAPHHCSFPRPLHPLSPPCAPYRLPPHRPYICMWRWT
jgi:hypothetical protein